VGRRYNTRYSYRFPAFILKGDEDHPIGGARLLANLVRAIRDGAGDSINRPGQAIVERQLTIQSTIRIRPGLPVRVILTRDLVLEPYGEYSPSPLHQRNYRANRLMDSSVLCCYLR
jgi:hypothetical protein